LTLLNRWLSGSSAYANYQKFVRQIVAPLFTSLGVEIVATEPKLDRYARAMAINLACEAGLESCLTQSAAKLQQVVAGSATIAPDLQSAIYCNGLRQGNAASNSAFSFLQDKMLQSQDQAERTLIINALGCSQTSSLLINYLNLAIQPGTSLRLQEKFRVLAAPLSAGEVGLEVLIDFTRANFQEISELGPNQLNTVLGSIAPRVSSQVMFNKFEALLTTLEQAEGLTSEGATGYNATAKTNLEWQEKHLGVIGTWLETYDDVVTTEAPTVPPTASTVTSPNLDTTSTTTIGAGSVVASMVVLTVCAMIKVLV
jgi:aminopeptidase N